MPAAAAAAAAADTFYLDASARRGTDSCEGVRKLVCSSGDVGDQT